MARFDRPVPRGGPRLAAAIGGQAARQLAVRSPVGARFVRPAGDRERVARAVRAYLNLAELFYMASQKPQSAYAALRQINLAEALGPSPELVESYGALCIICGVVGRRRMAERYAQLAFAVAAQVGDPAANAIIRHQASLFRSGLGQFERVLADEDAAIAIYRETRRPGPAARLPRRRRRRRAPERRHRAGGAVLRRPAGHAPPRRAVPAGDLGAHVARRRRPARRGHRRRARAPHARARPARRARA